jgi:hypothetical protein
MHPAGKIPSRRKTVFFNAVTAAMMFFAVASQCGRAAEPIDLTGKYSVTLASMTNSTWLAWKTTPVGHQVFHGVPFEIGGLVYLWGEGKSTNHSSPYPERVGGIAVNRKFETLYVCHGSYYKSPDELPVVLVVLRYADGAAATNTLRYGDDIIDWKVSRNESPLRTPAAANSSLAWVGGVFSATDNSRLRYCLTALANPHPDREVATVDLISCKTRTVPFIFAMTTGPAGLVSTGSAGGQKP